VFAIIAYGKLGGKELGYASDLTLFFFTTIRRPGAGSRLVQRVNHWPTSMTCGRRA
jgi:glutamate-ammonia-ligase adenylyltransferase